MDLKAQVYRVTAHRMDSYQSYRRFLEMLKDVSENKDQQFSKDLVSDVVSIYKTDEEFIKILYELDKHFAAKIISSNLLPDKTSIEDVIAGREVLLNNKDFNLKDYEDYEEIKEMMQGYKNPYIVARIVFLRMKLLKKDNMFFGDALHE